MYRYIVKPVMDFTISLLLFLVLLPVILLIGLILASSTKVNPFFVQARPGKHGRIFKLVKFRTMKNTRDHNGVLLPDRQRITRQGRVIRSLSLDELPQLINVIKGDMSLVGPRPLLTEYLDLYTDEQKRRHDVKPGITGWAQVNGRNTISWSQKFEHDVWYVDNQSFWLDLKILFLTAYRVIRREGINSSESHTMEAFNGRN